MTRWRVLGNRDAKSEIIKEDVWKTGKHGILLTMATRTVKIKGLGVDRPAESQMADRPAGAQMLGSPASGQLSRANDG